MGHNEHFQRLEMILKVVVSLTTGWSLVVDTKIFANIFLLDRYIIIYLLPCFYIYLDILKNDLYNGQHSNSCTFPTTYLLALFSQFYQFCKFENASQNSLPFCLVQFLSLVVIRFHNLRHFWNSQGILFQKWPRFWKLFKDRWRYGTKHGRWQM